MSRAPTPRRSLDSLIREGAARIARLDPADAFSAAAGGALIIDIRARESRERDGIVPGSIHIPRTVLEWRIATDSPWRNPNIGGTDSQLILMCDHGYATILAASNLVQLGFHRTGDVIGGFEAWHTNGLPVAPYREPASPPDSLPGTGAPE